MSEKHKLVPVEPTEHMLDSGQCASFRDIETQDAVRIYEAMLAAAPDVQGEPVAVINGSHCFSLDDANRLIRLPTGTKLYAAPQPAEQQPAPDEWKQAVDAVADYAHLYSNGLGVIHEIRAEHTRLTATHRKGD